MKNNMRAALITAAVLAGCGGGGGGSDAPASATATPAATAPTGAEGFYSGTAGPYDFGAVILETGEFWGIYSSGGVVQGAVHGSSTETASTFTGSGYDYNLPTQSRTASSFSGTYAPGASITGTISSSNTAFTGKYDASYLTPATISSITGQWTGNVATAGRVDSGSFTIDASGAISGRSSSCAYTGTVASHAATAVFDVSVTFAQTGCLFNGQTVSGIAVLLQGTLFTAGLLPDKSAGLIASSHR